MADTSLPSLHLSLSHESKENAKSKSPKKLSSRVEVASPTSTSRQASPHKQTSSASSPSGDRFFGQTVQELQAAFSSIQKWASPSNRSMNPSSTSKVEGSYGKGSCSAEVTSVPGSVGGRGRREHRSFLGAFTACTCDDDSSPLTTMRRMVDEVVNLETLITESNEYGDVSMISSDDDADEMQMHRLTSWGTVGTYDTIGTLESAATQQHELDPTLVRIDDYGDPINPRLLEKTIEASQKRSTKRKRLVKFDYPPVSALRECPRIPQDELSKMFFSPEELDQIESDRISTSVADDVEVVAVPTKSPPVSQTKASAGTPRHAGKPSMSPAAKFQAKTFASAEPSSAGKETGNAKRSPSRSPKSPGERSVGSTTDEYTSNGGSRAKDNRLVKSVQIYLRERSTGQRGDAGC